MMHVLLFVCEVSMMRECEDDSNASVTSGEGVAAGYEYIGGSDVVSSADDRLEMSVE